MRRIRDGANPLVSSELGQNWLDVNEILTRLSPLVGEDKIANWSSNLVALPGAPAGTSLALRKELLPNISTEIGTAIIPFDPRSYRDFMLYECPLGSQLRQAAIDPYRGALPVGDFADSSSGWRH